MPTETNSSNKNRSVVFQYEVVQLICMDLSELFHQLILKTVTGGLQYQK